MNVRIFSIKALLIFAVVMFAAANSRAATPTPLWSTVVGEVRAAAFSPDGKTLALHGLLFPDECAPGQAGASCSAMPRAELRDARTGERRLRTGIGGDNYDYTFGYTPDGERIVNLVFTTESFGVNVRAAGDLSKISGIFLGSMSHTWDAFVTPDLRYAVTYNWYSGGRTDSISVRVYKITGQASDSQYVWRAGIDGPMESGPDTLPRSPYKLSRPAALLLRDPDTLAVRAKSGAGAIEIRRLSDGAILRTLTPEEWEAEKSDLLPPDPRVAGSGQFIAGSPDGRIRASLATKPGSAAEPGVGELTFWKAGQSEPLDFFIWEHAFNAYSTPLFSPDFNLLLYAVPARRPDGSAYGVRLTAALNPYGNLGDVDLNGRVGVEDAVRSLRFLVGLDAPTTDERFRADANGDDALTIADVVLTLTKALQAPG